MTTTARSWMLRAVAAGAAATTMFAVSGCSDSTGPTADAPAPAAVSSAAPSAPGSPQSGASSAPVPAADAGSLIESAARSARILRSVHVDFSSTGISDLLAESYAADVTTQPAPASRGSASLKIRGQYRQTDFKIGTDGRLKLEGADGKWTDVGAARGKFDPAVLLDPKRGIGALVAAVRDAKIDGDGAQVDGHDAVKVTGTMPANALTALIPKSSIGDRSVLPVSVWVAPKTPNDLIQMIVGIGDGSITLKMSKGAPFTIPA